MTRLPAAAALALTLAACATPAQLAPRDPATARRTALLAETAARVYLAATGPEPERAARIERAIAGLDAALAALDRDRAAGAGVALAGLDAALAALQAAQGPPAGAP